MNGGIGIIEMLKRTNLLALVGGGKNPKFPLNQLIIWDDHQGKIMSKLRFNENIMSVRLRSDKIIALSKNKFYVFNMETLVTITIINTYDNPLGIIATSNGDNNKLIVGFPYEAQGHILLCNINQKCEKLCDTINAHNSRIACISINKEGTLLATASDKGTLIRIFSTNDGQKISEFRRGNTQVEMNCITFDQNNKFIGCSSNVGTIHIFSIAAITKDLVEKNKETKNEEDEPKNSKSLLGKIGGLFNIKNAYIDTERSFAKFKISEENSLIGFGNENTFVVITMEGKYYQAAYPKMGGDCIKITEKNMLVDI